MDKDLTQESYYSSIRQNARDIARTRLPFRSSRILEIHDLVVLVRSRNSDLHLAKNSEDKPGIRSDNITTHSIRDPFS